MVSTSLDILAYNASPHPLATIFTHSGAAQGVVGTMEAEVVALRHSGLVTLGPCVYDVDSLA